MTERLVSFHYRGALCYAFLGVHIVGVVSETGKWMSALDGDVAWRNSSGDLAAAKAAITAHVREWYDAAHQPLQAGQAERICEQLKRRPRPQAAVRIKEVEPQAVALRLMRDGVVTTYVLPPVADYQEPPKATLDQARMYCVSAQEVAENKLRAMPGDQLAAHELAVFSGLLRLIDACSSSGLIRGELKKIAQAREAQARLESTRSQNDQGEETLAGDAA